MSAVLINMVGRRVGRLVVVALAGRHATSRAALWTCRCDCGKTAVVDGAALRRTGTTSCGCRRRELGQSKTLTHGQSRRGRWAPEYRTWAGMHWRVKSPSPRTAPYYRDRGITVCARWASFENFLADMGRRPRGASIDRIDNDGNYEPGNCRWATTSQQNANRRHFKKAA